jgi:MHS family proline/betaine transporter-like MFS transporter
MSFSANKKISFIVILGNVLEFYDLGLYGFFAPQIASLYFPAENKFVLLLASLGIFAAGFITRPLGALIFGYIGDFLGRKITLTHTMLLMAFPTFIISILPDYQTMGVLSPLLLLSCRLLQGICTGGEYNNAAIFMLEHCEPAKRGLYSGLMTASSILGFFLASCASLLITFLSLPSGSWRIAFLLGALIGVVGFYFRRSYIAESPEFKKQGGTTLFVWSEIKSNLRAMCYVMAIGCFAGTLSLSLIGYIPTYLSVIAELSSLQTLFISNLGVFIYMIFLPLFGFLSDKLGARILMKAAAVIVILGCYNIFLLMSSGEFISALVAVIILALLCALFLGPMHAYMLHLFPPSFRCRGISISFSLGTGILGGIAPLVSTYLINTTGQSAAPAFYFILSASFVLLVFNLKIRDNFVPKQNVLIYNS